MTSRLTLAVLASVAVMTHPSISWAEEKVKCEASVDIGDFHVSPAGPLVGGQQDFFVNYVHPAPRELFNLFVSGRSLREGQNTWDLYVFHAAEKSGMYTILDSQFSSVAVKRIIIDQVSCT